MGVKGESERVTADARSAADVGGAGECGERGKGFGDLCPSDEAVAAQAELVNKMRHARIGN